MYFEYVRVNDQPVRNFQVFGERSSGTNFTNHLLRQNLNMRPVHCYGWKHGYPSMLSIPSNALIVVVFRNTHDWLRSMYKKPWHTIQSLRQLSFSEFLRSEWQTISDIPGVLPDYDKKNTLNQVLQLDRHPITGRPYNNIIELRNIKTASFLGFLNRGCNVVCTQYEYISANPQDFLQRVASLYDLEFSGDVASVTTHLGTGGFTRHAAPKDFSESDLDFIHEWIDHDQESRIGYDTKQSLSPARGSQ